MDTKKCNTCHVEKPFSEFHANASMADGLSHICKTCRKLHSKKYYEENKDKILAKNALWAQRNRAKKNAYLADFKRRKRSEKKRTCRICGSEIEKYKSICQPCKKKNKAECLSAYYQKNRSEILEWNRQYNASQNRKNFRKNYQMQYRLTRIDLSESRRKHYALMKDNLGFSATMAAARCSHRSERGKTGQSHILHLYKWQEGCCYYCNTEVKKGQREFDHIIPVSLGGSAYPYNIVLACKSCNQEKRDLLFGAEWNPRSVLTRENISSKLQKEVDQFMIDNGINISVSVLSSFWASERNLANAKSRVDEISGIIIYDHEWMNHRSAWENLIKSKGHVASISGARTMNVSIIDYDSASSFLNKNHVQGSVGASIYTGLVNNNGDVKGVAIYVFKKNHWELSRLAFDGHIPGGFGKLITFFRRKIQGHYPLLSYVDLRHGDGNSYIKMGFDDRGVTASPMYFYATPSGIDHRLKGSVGILRRTADFFHDGFNEIDINRINGRFRLFGKLQKRFVLLPD